MPSKRRARKALTQLSQTKAALGFVGGKKLISPGKKEGTGLYSKSEPAIKGAPTTVKEAKQNLKMKKQTRRKSIRGQVGYRIKSKLAGVKTGVVTFEKRNKLNVPVNPISVVQRRKNRKGFTVKGSGKVFKQGDKKFNKKVSQALGGVRGFATKATRYVAGESTPFAMGAPNPASTKIKFSTLRKTLSPRVKEARQQLKQLRKAKRK
tara:strand:- start:63 stop:683 length:621 start_codon:yes stop_codon:yes gene_type:complete